jgi:hypothetical protein
MIHCTTDGASKANQHINYGGKARAPGLRCNRDDQINQTSNIYEVQCDMEWEEKEKDQRKHARIKRQSYDRK